MDIILLPLFAVLLLGWSPFVACAVWMLGMVVCALAWTGIVAALSLIGRVVRS